MMSNGLNAQNKMIITDLAIARFLDGENERFRIKRLSEHPKKIAAEQERDAKLAEFEILESVAAARETAAKLAAQRQR